MEEGPMMIDRCYSSITLIWSIPKHTNHDDGDFNDDGANNKESRLVSNDYIYELQMNDGKIIDEWRTLSDTIRTNTIKKNNLIPTVGYRFRVRYRSSTNVSTKGNDWSNYSISSCEYYVLSSDFKMMKSPSMITNDDVSITLQWESINNATGK